MKSSEKKKPTDKKSSKGKDENTKNPEAGTGKQDREQSRTAQSGTDEEFEPQPDNETEENTSVNQNLTGRKDHPEQNPQKRKVLGEDEGEVAKQGKNFEPGIDEIDKNDTNL
jgi:hypothetical protein